MGGAPFVHCGFEKHVASVVKRSCVESDRIRTGRTLDLETHQKTLGRVDFIRPGKYELVPLLEIGDIDFLQIYRRLVAFGTLPDSQIILGE